MLPRYIDYDDQMEIFERKYEAWREAEYEKYCEKQYELRQAPANSAQQSLSGSADAMPKSPDGDF